MPSVREVMLNRAKEPAKIHSIERASATPSPSSSAHGTPAEHLAARPSPSPTAGAPPRPPRAPGSAGPPTPASQAGTPQGARRPAARRTPSEPPGSAGVDSPSRRAEGPGPQAKARASSASKAQPKAQPKLGGPPPPVDKKNVGKVPAYLKKRQEEMAEIKREAERPKSPQPPAGYRKVGDAEKEATLEVLQQRREEVEKAQRALPFKIETIGQKQRESDLNNRLAHIEKLKGMFSQPRVFIPVDAEPIGSSVPPLAAGGRGTPTAHREAEPPAAGAQNVQQGGMREAMQRPGSGEEVNNQPRQASRESRAAASAVRRKQNGILHPWDQEEALPSPPVRTGVQVAAPPGGRSSLAFDWQ